MQMDFYEICQKLSNWFKIILEKNGNVESTETFFFMSVQLSLEVCRRKQHS